ncbi:MAG: glutathione peroxidase [Ruminococcus sp.]
MAIYEYKVRDAKGRSVPMAEYRGKVLLIVNTATGCGFTPQYEGLQTLYEKYAAEGFEVLDFPCNQFANQAPGDVEDIISFCRSKYHTTFQQFDKVDVNGRNATPLFSFLKKERGGMLGSDIKWNFTKFLVDRQGKVVGRFSPVVTPDQIEDKIKELL